MPTPDVTDYYRLTQLTAIAVSPDGDRIAFIADEFDEAADERRRSLFVVPADGSDPPHRLTRVSDAQSPAWSPDGSKLGFIAERDTDSDLRVGPATDDEIDENGDEDDEQMAQLWVFDMDRGGDARQITDFEEGVREFDWGPHGEQIVVSARDPTDAQQEQLEQRRDDGPIEVDRLQHKYDGQGWLDNVTTYLFVVDLDSRETTRLDDAYGAGAAEPGTGLAPAWSPVRETIAFLSNRTERPDDSTVMDVFTINPDGSGCTQLTESDVSATGIEWGPDGNRLAFAAGHPDDGYEPTQVYVASRDGDYRSLSADLDRTLDWGTPMAWTDSETILGVIGDEGLSRLARFHTDGDVDRVFDGQGRDRTIGGFDLGGGTIGVIISDPQAGVDVYSMPAEDVDADGSDPDPLTRLTAINEELLSDYEAPTHERFTFESEGESIEGIIYHPPGADTDDTPPLIVIPHGGPISFDAPSFGFERHYWLNQGYAVLVVNFRGSSSYGHAFASAIKGDWGNHESTDVINGIETVLDRGWADPDRVFVTGFSYGGAQTAYILRDSDLVVAGAAEHGIYDRHAYFGTGDSHARMEREFGRPWENLDTYRRVSSITDVDAIDDPLLITAGENDWRCPPTQAEQLYVSVKKQGVPAKLVIYPDEHHNVTNPNRAIHRLREITEWFETYDPAIE
ncbi:MAG: prolyl oligopeptidase family serine peptidase [Halobacteriales archaeon]